ncbi:MAG: hypothetical protein M1828_001896 [Chrysothrix sp. TS-e1954]|nr:MAG: hypothetical protein M1828_001896 [Chrysothrix sp. TS-e1954]
MNSVIRDTNDDRDDANSLNSKFEETSLQHSSPAPEDLDSDADSTSADVGDIDEERAEYDDFSPSGTKRKRDDLEPEPELVEHIITMPSKAKPKFYAIRQGHEPGIYTDWAVAEEQVRGFPGCVFKSFKTREEADAYLKDDDAHAASEPPPKKKKRIMPNARENGDLEDYAGPGLDALPPDAEDGFDPRIKLNPETGKLEYKKAAERDAATIQTTGIDPNATIHVWTDGSTLSNGKADSVGGIGIWFGPKDKRNVSSPLPGSKQTNNRAELTSILRTFPLIPPNQPLTIHTDSQYAINCLTKWHQTWSLNNWTNAAGKPVENRDLIEQILGVIGERRRVGRVETRLEWVRGHEGDVGNEGADGLAVGAAREAQRMG